MTDAPIHEPSEYGEVAAKLWLFLLKAGGRWSSLDVAAGIGESGLVASQMLSAMSRSGQVRQFPVEGKTRRFQYGVTAACKVPRAVTVDDVVGALQAQEEVA